VFIRPANVCPIAKAAAPTPAPAAAPTGPPTNAPAMAPAAIPPRAPAAASIRLSSKPNYSASFPAANSPAILAIPTPNDPTTCKATAPAWAAALVAV
jgi:hypothetical protein